MVLRAEKRSLREASCCSVEVVNGAAGRRARSRFSTLLTRSPPAAASTRSRAACAAASSTSPNLPSLLPSSACRRASKALPPRAKRAVTDQYSRGSKASISASRSTISLSAGLCTRPADSFGAILRHSSGDRLKPTR